MEALDPLRARGLAARFARRCSACVAGGPGVRLALPVRQGCGWSPADSTARGIGESTLSGVCVW